MVTSKLKQLFYLSVPVFMVHGFEEYITGFYAIDPWSKFILGSLEVLPSNQAIFLLLQIMIGLLLTVSALLLKGGAWIFRLFVFYGFVYLFELHHLVKAILVGGYYPGVITAFLIYILGFLYWKELIKVWKRI